MIIIFSHFPTSVSIYATMPATDKLFEFFQDSGRKGRAGMGGRTNL